MIFPESKESRTGRASEREERVLMPHMKERLPERERRDTHFPILLINASSHRGANMETIKRRKSKNGNGANTNQSVGLAPSVVV